MVARGSEFGEVQPQVGRDRLIAVDPTLNFLDTPSFGAGDAINQALIQRVTPLNAFRLGQQIFFWLGVAPGTPETWASQVRLKLWWLRPNKEYRPPGDPSYLPIDNLTFFPGPAVGVSNNRYCWVPSPKRLDITPFQTTTPPAASPAFDSDSILLDDCLVLDLPDPSDAQEILNFPSPQVVSRWVSFFYPAMGYALGVTWDATAGGQVVPETLDFSLTWTVGTLGGTVYQESMG